MIIRSWMMTSCLTLSLVKFSPQVDFVSCFPNLQKYELLYDFQLASSIVPSWCLMVPSVSEASLKKRATVMFFKDQVHT